MTDNPIKQKAAQPKRSVQEWIDRGNRILWGQEPTSKGDYLNRPELHWCHRDGHYFIERR